MPHSASSNSDRNRPVDSQYPVDRFEVSVPANPVWGDDLPLDLDVAAKFTGMPLPTFKQKVYGREIASVKVGRRRRVRPSAIRAYVRRHERPAV